MKKGHISNLLRHLRLIYLSDRLRYYIVRFKNRRINKDFRKKNPEVKLPPDYLIYESFQISYPKYYTESIETARWLANHFKKHIDPKNKRILDWGCGPGRLIRHLPLIIGNVCEYWGTDYSKRSIDWCAHNLSGIKFNNNSLEARLPYNNNFFDIIYGISVFTHLSEKLHFDWYSELFRILKPGGIMFFTTSGNNFKVKLTNSELRRYNNNELIVRGKVKEGHRTFSAFHPKGFMMQLFENTEVLEHIETRPEKGKALPQDIWIIRK